MKYAIKRFYKNEPNHNLKGTMTVLFEYDEDEKHFCTRMRIIAPEFKYYEPKFERVQIINDDISFEAENDENAMKMFEKLSRYAK